MDSFASSFFYFLQKSMNHFSKRSNKLSAVILSRQFFVSIKAVASCFPNNNIHRIKVAGHQYPQQRVIPLLSVHFREFRGVLMYSPNQV